MATDAVGLLLLLKFHILSIDRAKPAVYNVLVCKKGRIPRKPAVYAQPKAGDAIRQQPVMIRAFLKMENGQTICYRRALHLVCSRIGPAFGVIGRLP